MLPFSFHTVRVKEKRQGKRPVGRVSHVVFKVTGTRI